MASAARAVLTGLAGLLALGIAAVIWSTSRTANVPPPDVHAEDRRDTGIAPAVSAHAAAAAPTPPVAPAPQRSLAADPARLEGVLSDARGGFLRGWWIRIAPIDPPYGEAPAGGVASLAATDEQGHFTFAELRPGRYAVSPAGERGNEQVVDLAAGERRGIELRLQGCMLLIVLQRQGTLAADLSAEVVASDGVRVVPQPVAHDGRWRCIVPAGTHSIHVFDARGVRACGERRVVTYAGQSAASVAVDVTATWLEAIVDDGTTLPIPALSFEVKGHTTDGAEVLRQLGSADGRRAAGEIPAGTWSVHVQSPRLLEAPPQLIEIAPGQPLARVVFAAERCGFARLTLLTSDGRSLPALASGAVFPRMPAMTDRAGERPCVDLARWLGRDTPTPGLVDLPAGPTTFSWTDRVLDGEVAYLPFDPPPPRTLEVLLEGENLLELRVEPRALVTLIACERGGREDLKASVRVFSGVQRVRSMASNWPSRWSSFLPPGDYRAVVEHAGGTREHPIQVGRAQIEARLRP